MKRRFVENASCPECDLEGALTTRDCPRCRKSCENQAVKKSARLSFSGAMFIIAGLAVVFAAARSTYMPGSSCSCGSRPRPS